MYDRDMDFSYNCVITIELNLDLEILFKFTAHSLPKRILNVKYKPVWARGREDLPQTSDLGRTDGRKN